MKKIQIVTLAVLLMAGTFVASCNKDEDTNPGGNSDNAYKGSWEGTFSGDDNGTWTAVIGADGKIDGGLVSSNVPGTTFPISGTVSASGSFDAFALVVGDSVAFTGQGTSGTSASGIWDNSGASISGTWTGSKK